MQHFVQHVMCCTTCCTLQNSGFIFWHLFLGENFQSTLYTGRWRVERDKIYLRKGCQKTYKHEMRVSQPQCHRSRKTNFHVGSMAWKIWVIEIGKGHEMTCTKLNYTSIWCHYRNHIIPSSTCDAWLMTWHGTSCRRNSNRSETSPSSSSSSIVLAWRVIRCEFWTARKVFEHFDFSER